MFLVVSSKTSKIMLKQTPQGLEYTLFAFTTEKGLFTLSGSQSNGIDTFKQLTKPPIFNDWNRQQIYDWFIDGKINPVDQSKCIEWYMNPTLLKQFNTEAKNDISGKRR